MCRCCCIVVVHSSSFRCMLFSDFLLLFVFVFLFRLFFPSVFFLISSTLRAIVFFVCGALDFPRWSKCPEPLFLYLSLFSSSFLSTVWWQCVECHVRFSSIDTHTHTVQLPSCIKPLPVISRYSLVLSVQFLFAGFPLSCAFVSTP